MKNAKEIIVDQIGLVLTTYRPFKKSMDEESLNNYEQLTKVYKDLKKSKRNKRKEVPTF